MTTVDDLTREVVQLRRELATLRDGLADEVRTRRVIVEDDEWHVEVNPGHITVSHRASGNLASLSADHLGGEVNVSAGDLAGADIGDIIHAALVATTQHYDADQPRCRAFLDLNGDEVAASVPELEGAGS